MEQVRSVRARYIKREAREGDDGMGLKYPQKQLGTRQMRIGLPLTRFLMKRHRQHNFSNTLSRMKMCEEAVFLFPCSCDRMMKTTPESLLRRF